MRPEDTLALLKIKTDELSRRHAMLTRRTEELRAGMTAHDDARTRFGLLHRGLQALADEGHVFEEASFADGLAEEIACGTASEEAIAAGVARLTHELDCATRRGAAAVLYGHLFDASETDQETTAELPGRAEALASLRAYWAQEATIDEPALAAVLEACAGPAPAVPDPVFAQGVSTDEVRAHLAVLARSFDHATEFRSYCRRLASDQDAVRDLSGALTILLRDLDRFRWEDWPTTISLRWNRTRWRAFLDAELLPQLLLECVALRLGVVGRGSFRPRTLETRQLTWDFFDHRRNDEVSELVLPGMNRTIEEYTAQAPNAYAGAGSITGAPDPYQRLFLLLNAERWWHATAFGPGSVQVAQTDLQDFFPSMPHATVSVLLDALGVPAPMKRFLVRYLRGPYQLDGQAVTVRTGLFPGHTLSRVLADLLLLALDAWVERRSRVALCRFMDDIYWVTHEPEASVAAWDALQEFTRVAGLRCNEAKTAVDVHTGSEAQPFAGPLPPIPRRRIRWAFLELDERATWVPRQEALEDFAASLALRLTSPAPVRQVVREYNAAVGYLVRGLAPMAPLGVEHVDRLGGALGRVHAHLFGPARGVVEHVRARLTERVPQLAGLIASLPPGWFSWPITAGGLGLYNPASLLAGARATHRHHAWGATPAHVENPRNDATWTLLYQTRARIALQVAPPRPSPAMAGRQRDFIARGSEVQDRAQASLHPYWQWLLETHAPELLDFFGTLRFLPTEVVPVQPLGLSSPSLVTQQTFSHDDDIPF